MKSIEVLVATMNEKDLGLYYDMNIKSDVVFANQASEYKYQESMDGRNHLKMITTPTKGVGKNRNIALLYSEGDICLLGDDDIHYVDNYPEILQQAFSELPRADIIIFNIDTTGKTERFKKNNSTNQVYKYSFMNYGSTRIAFKRESILRANLWFSLLFGGGTCYSSGEDSLFLREALRKGLKIYTYPATIGTVNTTKSSWFTGYNEKFFFDKGALICALFPILKYPIGLLYFPWRFRKETKLPKKKVRFLILAGIRAFKNGISYDGWKSHE